VLSTDDLLKPKRPDTEPKAFPRCRPCAVRESSSKTMQELWRPYRMQSRRCVEATRARPTTVRRPPNMARPPTHGRRFGFPLSVLVLVVIGLILPGCHCFTAPSIHRKSHVGRSTAGGVNLLQESAASSDGTSSAPSSDELIARRITVVGDVGGYYRACVINEVRFGVFVILSTLVFSSSIASSGLTVDPSGFSI
jgi:hypothetical protein